MKLILGAPEPQKVKYSLGEHHFSYFLKSEKGAGKGRVSSTPIFFFSCLNVLSKHVEVRYLEREVLRKVLR